MMCLTPRTLRPRPGDEDFAEPSRGSREQIHVHCWSRGRSVDLGDTPPEDRLPSTALGVSSLPRHAGWGWRGLQEALAPARVPSTCLINRNMSLTVMQQVRHCHHFTANTRTRTCTVAFLSFTRLPHSFLLPLLYRGGTRPGRSDQRLRPPQGVGKACFGRRQPWPGQPAREDANMG